MPLYDDEEVNGLGGGGTPRYPPPPLEGDVEVVVEGEVVEEACELGWRVDPPVEPYKDGRVCEPYESKLAYG